MMKQEMESLPKRSVCEEECKHMKENERRG